MGAILSQGEIGKDLPIAYASRTLNGAEQNYSVTEKELLAIVFGVKHFRPYLFGRPFIIATDHRPLTWLKGCKDPSSRLMRWKILLNDYDYEIMYKAGTMNSNADALSRSPVAEIHTLNIHANDRPSDNKTDPEESINHMQNNFLYNNNNYDNPATHDEPFETL